MTGLRSTAAALIAVSCLLAATAGTATAGSSTGHVSVSLHARSALSVNGDTVVQYQYSGHDTAQLSGQVTGGSAGEVATVLAQPFPCVSPFLQAGAPVRISGPAQQYSLTVQPAIATRYELQVTKAGDHGEVLATSPAQTVYVSTQVTFGSYAKTCVRPKCTLVVRTYVTTPPLSYPAEAAKRWYTYLALKLSRNREPKPATSLVLDTKAVISPVRQVSDDEFEVTARLPITIGRTDGYYWNVNMCQQNSYLIDGIGVPGTHGCGGPSVSSQPSYLG
jgi:hypothetical protein